MVWRKGGVDGISRVGWFKKILATADPGKKTRERQ